MFVIHISTIQPTHKCKVYFQVVPKQSYPYEILTKSEKTPIYTKSSSEAYTNTLPNHLNNYTCLRKHK